MAVSIPYQAIADAKQADPELWPILLAIAGPESTWRPEAVGDNGCSIGYMQMNTCGGLGDGHSKEELFNGVRNFQLAAQYIHGRLNSGASMYDAISPWTTRPTAWTIYQQILSEGIVGVDQMPGIPGPAAANSGLVKVGLAAVGLYLIVNILEG